MSNPSNPALGLSRALLKLMTILNLAFVALVIAALVASFVINDVVALYYRQRQLDPAILMPTLRVGMLLALPMAAAVHLLLKRLLAIVETVRLGDPFVPENAVRLKTIAWCVLALQLLGLAFGVVASIAASANAEIDWDFSLTGWVFVVLLFVLAQVFEEGTRIRDDLKAMI